MAEDQAPVARYDPINIQNIIINGESYIPRPHEVDPDRFGTEMVWSSFPWDELWMSDPEWYSSLGEDQITQRRIWSLSSPEAQIDAFEALSREFPTRSLDMMFEAAVKGKAHVLQALLEAGVKPAPNASEGDDMSLVPLHAAAFQGHLDCVRVLVEKGGIDVNALDDVGGTPLIRASWGGRADIVRWLLEKGADVWTRQSTEPHVSAFEFAAGSGCFECVQLLLGSAGDKKLELLTPLALAAAAAARKDDESVGAETFMFLLKEMNYPLPDSLEKGVSLSPLQKSSLQTAFCRAIELRAINTIPTLLAYIKSKDDAGASNFEVLSPETFESVILGWFRLMERSSEDDLTMMRKLFDMFLSETPEYAHDSVQKQRGEVLDSSFVVAAQMGKLSGMRLIAELHPSIDVNAISLRTKPHATTALSLAAGGGQIEMLEWLLERFGAEIDFHRGNGRFINGPTALWTAIANKQAETVKLLLRHGHGPVDVVDPSTEPEPGLVKKVGLAAADTYRNPIRMFTAEDKDWDRDGTVLHTRTEQNEDVWTMWLELDETDRVWWQTLEQRDPDAVLDQKETFRYEGERERRLRENPSPTAPIDSGGESSWLRSAYGFMSRFSVPGWS